ncbi:MAG: FAD-dependent oxidoreductase, partial [Gemmatimonadota bacterium]|nr:FAD-dependent oxidoreductase [Gemmatimonadota bacterium]
MTDQSHCKDIMDSARIVIIGAGLAGMATAYQLAREGENDILILEKEELPGMHSSGRSAAMIRQIVPERGLLDLSRSGAEFFRGHLHQWDCPPPFIQTGSLLVASGKMWSKLKDQAREAGTHGIEYEVWDHERVEEFLPCTSGGDFTGGIWCSGDGVADADRLLQGFYRQAHAAGVRMRTGLEVAGLEVAGGRVLGVETSEGTVRCEIVVNAAGAWAKVVGELAGARSIELTPLRRHLYYTGELDWVDPRWPYVWDVAHEVYFRPESAGLLFSPCDESRSVPKLPAVDPEVE